MFLWSMWVGLGVRANAGASHVVSSMGQGMGRMGPKGLSIF
jgi:hypothetical protein